MKRPRICTGSCGKTTLKKKKLNVAGCKCLKYLPPTEVKNLQLGELGCGVDPILFRKEYSLTLKRLEVRRSDIGGVVVLGQPGIGTSLLWTDTVGVPRRTVL